MTEEDRPQQKPPANQGPPAPWIVGLSGLALAFAAIGWVIVEMT